MVREGGPGEEANKDGQRLSVAADAISLELGGTNCNIRIAQCFGHAKNGETRPSAPPLAWGEGDQLPRSMGSQLLCRHLNERLDLLYRKASENHGAKGRNDRKQT